MNNLSSQWIWFGLAAFAILFGLSTIAWALRTAECYEHDEDPIAPIDDYEPVNCQEIIDSERPYISYQ
jgi:hypothetical protein